MEERLSDESNVVNGGRKTRRKKISLEAPWSTMVLDMSSPQKVKNCIP
jgi:hypothetical protein